MRDEKGVWCDRPDHQAVPALVEPRHGRQEVTRAYKPGKTAVHIITCVIEQSEYAVCNACYKEWIGRTHGMPDFQRRCPRCLPRYLEGRNIPGVGAPALPPPITGPLAEAFRKAMHDEAVLGPTITRVLQRMAAIEDPYVAGILNSTSGTPEGYEDLRAI